MRRLRRFAVVALLATLALELGLRFVLGNMAIAGLLRWGLADGRPLGLAPGARVEYTGYFLKLPPVVQEVNALGYRGPERPFARAPGTRRIALVGSSHVYGVGVAEAEGAAAQLETLLPPDTEVLNLGVPGMSVDELVPHVERFACRFEPDALVYVMSPRDLDDPMFTASAPVRPELVAGLFRHLYTTRAAAVGLVAGVLVVRHLGGRPPLAAEVLAKKKQREARLVEQIGRLARACRRGLGVVSLADARLEALLAAHAETAAVPVLDVAPLTSDATLKIPHENHFNAAGNRALAERLAAWLSASGLLPRAPAAEGA